MKSIYSKIPVVAVGLSLCIVSTVVAQPALPTAAAEKTTDTTAAAAPAHSPKIAFAETTHDFGRVVCGQPIKVEFVFTNVGDATLEISEVKPHCGCTVAGTWDRKVEPGMTGKIPLSIDSGRFDGMIAKSAAVTCNDTNHASTELTIRGTVWKPISVNPSVVSFIYPPGQPAKESRTVVIKNNGDEQVSISEVTSLSPAFQAELKTITPDKEFNLIITTVPEAIKDRDQSSVTFKTTSTNMPTGSITVIAYPNPNPVPPAAAAPAAPTPAPAAQAAPRVVPVNADAAKLPKPPVPESAPHTAHQ